MESQKLAHQSGKAMAHLALLAGQRLAAYRRGRAIAGAAPLNQTAEPNNFPETLLVLLS